MYRSPLFYCALVLTAGLSISPSIAQTHPTNPFLSHEAGKYSGHDCVAPSIDQKTTLSWTVGGLRALAHHHWQRCTYSSPLNAMVWEDVPRDEIDDSKEKVAMSSSTASRDTAPAKNSHDGMDDFTNVFSNGVSEKFTSIGGKKKHNDAQ